jgi:hypothetical protein
MPRSIFLILAIFLLSPRENRAAVAYLELQGELITAEMTETANRPNPLRDLFRIRSGKNKKLVCAVLAFPFPFGMVGLHRIYMGTAPYVPVVYIATFGGVMILPLIDFFVIVFSKTQDEYINNGKVFMWID